MAKSMDEAAKDLSALISEHWEYSAKKISCVGLNATTPDTEKQKKTG